MKSIIITVFSLALIIWLCLCFMDFNKQNKHHDNYQEQEAGDALALWYDARAFPNRQIPMGKISGAFDSFHSAQIRASLFPGNWQPIGPGNFGGRTLSLAFNPQNPNTIYAGSASGGLWRSYSAGTGAQAWHPVPTGFPVLGVAAVAVNPVDTNEIYIGTGEVYNYQNTGTGFAVRLTRGTYGIGILKSNDCGTSWVKSLDWSYDSLRGVQDIIINPIRPSSLFAATTEGTFRSYDAGLTWQNVYATLMATDLLMMPGDTSVIFVACGNSGSANEGIYRSVDGGSTFQLITGGLPPFYTGKAMLDVSQSNPQILYASLADQEAGIGLYKSTDGGITWSEQNNTDYQSYQGWYSHDVLVHPNQPSTILTCGVDMWKSVDSGITLAQMSYWYNWDFNMTTPGAQEGPPDYVHADIHRMYRHPVNSNEVYLVTDGGIFRSTDFGETFQSCNGGYQTQQFYANFSCSATDSLFAIGGMQDNATAVYEGNLGWRRVIGGDGVSTAINPQDDQVVFGSSQYLSISRSNNHAVSFNGAGVPGGGSSSNTCFAGPFAMSMSSPNILYAGRDKVYKTTNAGMNWSATNGNTALDGNPVITLEISATNPNLVYASTAPVNNPQVGLFKTSNGGTSWSNITAGIPNRYILDIAVDPLNNNRVFVVTGGFGTPHLYLSANGGSTWTTPATGIPDVPAHTITIDPLNPQVMYLGNDLGVYVSIDGGLTWQPFSEGLFDATEVMDISISPSNRMLRLATHGKGVYQRPMLPVTVTQLTDDFPSLTFSLYPNPCPGYFRIQFSGTQQVTKISITDLKGKMVKTIESPQNGAMVDVTELRAGIYFVVVSSGNRTFTKKLLRL